MTRLGALLAAALVAAAGPARADLDHAEDGGYRWHVPAGADGQGACCRHVLRGGASLVGCNLGSGKDGPRPGGDCETTSELLAVYVEVSAGAPRRIHAFSGACPVDTGAPVNDLGEVTTAESLRWLAGRLNGDPRLLDGALLAIAFHEDADAVRTLVAASRDARLRDGARERALFWLVQSNTEEAWAYLDRLLEP